MRRGNTCGMRLRTGDPTLLDDLRAHFERSGFAVESTGDGDLDVRRPDAPSVEQEAREIELHLMVWRAMQPSIQVELVDPEGASS
jgi:hypothetical protein